MSEDESDITLTINVNDGQSLCNESELVLNFSVVMEGGRQCKYYDSTWIHAAHPHTRVLSTYMLHLHS